jgi:hypothetical protein
MKIGGKMRKNEKIVLPGVGSLAAGFLSGLGSIL